MTAFISRRRRLLNKMRQGIAIIPTAPQKIRNRDAHYPYRSDSYFHYLTGFDEPEAVLVLTAGKVKKSIFFCQEKNAERELWEGFRYGPQAAAKKFGFDEAHPIKKLDELMPQLLANQPAVFYAMGMDFLWDKRLNQWLNAVRNDCRKGIIAPQQFIDIRSLLDDMRLIKDSHEIDIMRRAAQISASAHQRAMRAARPGKYEYEIEAELLYEFRRHGSQYPAYTSIVASGANACVLHYIANNAPLKKGDLLLIDAGCELDGYASDLTRTFPISGKFSPAQKDLYQVVLEAQFAAIAKAKKGQHWEAPHEAALRVLARGFIDLKLCKGSVDSVIESGDYKRFYMHRTGHWLGRDVHDVGDYKIAGKWRKLQPGMVLTVEPGCYVRPGKNVPKAFWNMGIRIEDDVLITPLGNEVLTANAPKKVDEIEAIMKVSSF